jgi:hypothetical protein
MISNLVPIAFLLLIGLSSLLLGITGVLGYRRYTYIFPFYYSGGLNYASIPWGITFLLLVIVGITPQDSFLSNFCEIVSLILILLGLIWSFTQPAFLTPKWLRWLVANHEEIIPMLVRDVRERGYKNWKEKTKTQEGLEEWVAEVRHKHEGIHFVPRRQSRK